MGAHHPGPRGEQAAGLLVLHPGAHRRDAVAAGRPGAGRPHRRGPRRRSRAIMADQYRRALLAFPDEDVLLGHPAADAGGLPGLHGLQDVVPFPEPQVLGRGAGLGPAPVEALRLREPARRPHLRPQGRRLGGRRARLLRAQGEDPRGGRRRTSPASTPTGATAWSPSAGPWPRTWPGASSAAEPRARRAAAGSRVSPGAARQRTPCSSGRPAAG